VVAPEEAYRLLAEALELTWDRVDRSRGVLLQGFCVISSRFFGEPSGARTRDPLIKDEEDR
jgi:hypothetical protein